MGKINMDGYKKTENEKEIKYTNENYNMEKLK